MVLKCYVLWCIILVRHVCTWCHSEVTCHRLMTNEMHLGGFLHVKISLS